MICEKCGSEMKADFEKEVLTLPYGKKIEFQKEWGDIIGWECLGCGWRFEE